MKMLRKLTYLIWRFIYNTGYYEITRTECLCFEKEVPFLLMVYKKKKKWLNLGAETPGLEHCRKEGIKGVNWQLKESQKITDN